MNTDRMFELAVRNKMRFPYKGLISTEDLWDLSIDNLDKVYKSLNSLVKEITGESLLNKKTKEQEDLDFKIEIIKHIVGVKQAEVDAHKKAMELKQQEQKILSVLASKQDEKLKAMPIEDLEQMLKNLNK